MKQTDKNVLIVGLPNCGKSQIFSNLTGEYTLVANYPLSTINIKRAFCTTEGCCYNILDTPGIYSLHIQSEEASAVREKLLSGDIDIVVQCLDANQLKQSLYLTAELMQLSMPMVLVLNAIDETSRKGIWIDSKRLSTITGVPVVESIAIKGVGTNRLKSAIESARQPKSPVKFGDVMETAILSINSLFPDTISYKRAYSIFALLNDHYIEEHIEKIAGSNTLQEVKNTVLDLKNRFQWNPSKLLSYTYSRWVDNVYDDIVKRHVSTPKPFSENLARYCRTPITGFPILIGVIIAVYFLVVELADTLTGLLEDFIWKPVEDYLKLIVTDPFWNDFLIGDHGVLSMGVAGALLTVLPILSVFFIIYSILEDVGYIPNLTVLSKRIFSKIGLSGATILPMVLGFGCKTMATLTTKTLSSKKERYITIFLIAFAIPCSPQIGLSMSLLGKIGISAFFISFSILVMVEIITGLILHKIIKEDRPQLFIQILPPIRVPNLMNIYKKTYYRLLEFLREAFPVFILASIVLFTLDKTGILGAIKVILEPIVKGALGLPNDMVEALIVLLARREASVAIIAKLIESNLLDYVQSIVAVTLTTMFFPCIANVGSIIKMLGLKSAMIMVTVITISSVIVMIFVNWLLRLFL
ncbi:MAG: ferrous iron transport protein B [Thermodesulfovibrionales bacterium]|nr:ferrous iron transport protein B [Thermodesulfovibrionales bacterium]